MSMSSKDVSGSARAVPHYDTVIAYAKAAVMQLGDKQVQVKKGGKTGFAPISKVLDKLPKAGSTTSRTPTRTDANLHVLLSQAEDAKITIKAEVKELQKSQDAPSKEKSKELVGKLAELNTYISKLKAHLATPTTADLASHKVDTSPATEGKTKITDRFKQAFSASKGVSGSIADQVKTRTEAIKAALTPKKPNDVTGSKINFNNDNKAFSTALQTAYALRDTKAGAESTVLAKAIENAEKHVSSQLRSPIDPDKANPKTLEKASSQLLSLTAELEHVTNAVQNLKDLHKTVVSALNTTFEQVRQAISKNPDSPDLKEALGKAKTVMNLTSPNTEQMGLQDLQNSHDALSYALEALQKAIKARTEFLTTAEKTIDSIIEKQVKNNPKSSATLKQKLMTLADTVGANEGARTLFLMDLNKVNNPLSLAEFLKAQSNSKLPGK